MFCWTWHLTLRYISRNRELCFLRGDIVKIARVYLHIVLNIPCLIIMWKSLLNMLYRVFCSYIYSARLHLSVNDLGYGKTLFEKQPVFHLAFNFRSETWRLGQVK